jgi:hypothetical protein
MGDGTGVSTATVRIAPRSILWMMARRASTSMASVKQFSMVSLTSGWSGGVIGPVWLSRQAT